VPVYHFTLHAYRSWSPDHPRGYTQRGKGYQPPDAEQAEKYDQRAKQPVATFDPEVQKLLIRIAHDFCKRRNTGMVRSNRSAGMLSNNACCCGKVIGPSFCSNSVLEEVKPLLRVNSDRRPAAL
jgi:hypothetical protein